MRKNINTPMGYISIKNEEDTDNITDMFQKTYEMLNLNEKTIKNFESETKRKFVTPFGCVYLKTDEAINCEKRIIDIVFEDIQRKPMMIISAN